MEKWCIKVTAENLPVVGKWFNENCQNENTKNDANWYLDTVFIGGHFHSPLKEDCLHYGKYIRKGYTEITFEQFKEKILKEPNQLQEILDKIKEKSYYFLDTNDLIIDLSDIEQIFSNYLNK